MSGDKSWHGHDLVADREVKIAGKEYRHRRCETCRRDFAILPRGSEWIAVHVGLLEFKPLDEETSRRWLSEECPGAPPE
jgi:hypothetical protein